MTFRCMTYLSRQPFFLLHQVSESETYIHLPGFSYAYQPNHGNLLHTTLLAESSVCMEGKMGLLIVAEVVTALEKG